MGFAKTTRLILLFAFAAVFFALAGCRSGAIPGEYGFPAAQEELTGPWSLSEVEYELGGKDPLEGFNRSMFACTHFLMDWVVDPLGRVYTTILPRPVIEMVDNACVNLAFPGRAVSCLLRAEWGGAGDESMRFLINTTLGVAGLFDPAEEYFDFYSTDSDFGQAFAAWGIGPGCTLILPLMATTNVRDTVGAVFDMAFDIKTYIPYAGYATLLNRLVVAREVFTSVVDGSSDPYKTYREMALINRQLQLDMFGYRAQNAAAKLRKEKEEAARLAAEAGEPPPPPEPRLPGPPKPEGLLGNWVDIPGYRSQGPVVDTLRVGMFQAQDDRSFWFYRLSLFNRDFSNIRKDLKLQLHEDRPALKVGFWAPPEPPEIGPPAPERLAILLPGIGGLYRGGTSVAIAELLHNRGFAILALDSTFAWQFMTATGPDRLPGFLPDDAREVRGVIAAALARLRQEEYIAEPEISLLGYSLGGLHTLKVAHLEAEENTLGIHRYLAINPPADLQYALARADELSLAGREWSRDEVREHISRAGGEALYVFARRYAPYNPAVELASEQVYQVSISEEEARCLAGIYLRNSLRGLLFTAHCEKPFPGLPPYAWGDRNLLYRVIDRIDFNRYVKEFVMPQYPERTTDDLFRESGLRSFEEFLKTSPDIRVLHNYDDFLLSPADRAWLDRTLQKRITWFSTGGHLGNLYTTPFQERIFRLQ